LLINKIGTPYKSFKFLYFTRRSKNKNVEHKRQLTVIDSATLISGFNNDLVKDSPRPSSDGATTVESGDCRIARDFVDLLVSSVAQLLKQH
jgi:hypothetical protein